MLMSWRLGYHALEPRHDPVACPSLGRVLLMAPAPALPLENDEGDPAEADPEGDVDCADGSASCV
jgi:hypothetical protein